MQIKPSLYLVVPRGKVGAGVEVHEQAPPEGVPVLGPPERGVRAVVHHVQQRERLGSQGKRGRARAQARFSCVVRVHA